MSTFFRHLTAPIEIRGKVFRNRIISAPSLMSIMMNPDGIVVSRDWLEDKIGQARGGIGCVCIGETVVDTVWADRWNIRFQTDPFYTEFISTMYVDYDNYDNPKMNTWRRIARDIHNLGSLAIVQIAHAGNMRVGLGAVPEGVPTALGPMGFTRENGEIVKAADEGDMRQVCASFERAARYFRDCGFDGVQVHGGHGWLITQFLSPATNQRKDEYGGSVKKRCNFPVEIIRAVRRGGGEDFVIEVRISGEETGVPGGYGVEQSIEFTKRLVGIADIVHISDGHYNRHDSSFCGGATKYSPHMVNLETAAKIKAAVPEMLINVVGGVNSPEQAEKAMDEGKCDFVSMAKQLYADPNFANKCMSGHPEDIQRCCECIHCDGGGQADLENWRVTSPPRAHAEGAVVLCSVNPERGLAPPEGGWPVVERAKKLLIVGGGVAGMMAATTAVDCGHIPIIIERSGRLGGTMNFTDNDCYKTDFKNYKDLLIRRIAERRIELRLDTQLSAELIQEIQPDVIIAAVGARAKVPPLPGIDRARHILDVYTDGVTHHDDTVVLGSSMFAGESAVWLANTASSVKLVKLNMKGYSSGSPTRIVEKKMAEMDIGYIKDAEITAVEEAGLRLADGGLIPAREVVYCVGMEPLREEVDRIRTLAGDIPVLAVGDCSRAADVANAIRAAFVAVKGLG